MLGRIARVFLAAFGVMIALSLVWFMSGALGSSVLRVVVGLILFLVVASLGIGYFRQVANPPPPDPVPTEVHPSLRLASAGHLRFSASPPSAAWLYAACTPLISQEKALMAWFAK